MRGKHFRSNILKTVPFPFRPAFATSLPRSSHAPACVFQCCSLFLATQLINKTEKIRICFSDYFCTSQFLFSQSLSSLISKTGKKDIFKFNFCYLQVASVYNKSTIYQFKEKGLQSTKSRPARRLVAPHYSWKRSGSSSPPIANLGTKRQGVNARAPVTNARIWWLTVKISDQSWKSYSGVNWKRLLKIFANNFMILTTYFELIK